MTEWKEYVCELSAEKKAYAAANSNETEDDRSAKIAEIRQWISLVENLRARDDDFFILRFLRACKFNVEKTKRKIRNYYTQRTALSDWYSDRNPFLPILQEILDLGVLLPLRKLDAEGRMVVIVRPAIHDPSKHKLADALKAALMVLDLATRSHETVTLNGVRVILDISGISYGHVVQLPPTVIKNLVHAWQGCYPLRIHSLNFVNVPTLVNVVLNIFRGFMNAKLRSRVHVYGRGTKAFYQTLPADVMPVEYEGTDGPVRELIDYWKRAVEENREWFVEDEKYKVIAAG